MISDFEQDIWDISSYFVRLHRPVTLLPPLFHFIYFQRKAHLRGEHKDGIPESLIATRIRNFAQRSLLRILHRLSSVCSPNAALSSAVFCVRTSEVLGGFSVINHYLFIDIKAFFVFLFRQNNRIRFHISYVAQEHIVCGRSRRDIDVFVGIAIGVLYFSFEYFS